MMSDRLSARADEPNSIHLAGTDTGSNSGAEATRSIAPLPRIGRRQLERLRNSLSDRDLAILRSMEACHYLTTIQIERMWFRGTGMTPLAAARGSRRTLSRLHRDRVIDHLDRRVGGLRAGSAAYVWALAEAGHRLLERGGRRRRTEPGVRHLDHVLAAAELLVRLHEAAKDGGLELIDAQTEPTCWRQLTTAHGGREWLKPDLRLTIGVGEYELHWWVEIDRGTEHRPTIARKAETYLRAWKEGSEQARSGVAPRVIWVAPDEKRQAVLDEVIAGLSGPEGMFLTATDETAMARLCEVGS